jgi:quercetin dioxygenase-like cupin family protein
MTDDNPHPAPLRRVVTGHGADHVAKVLKDAPAVNERHPGPGMVTRLLWCTDGTPADISVGEDIEDMGERVLGIAPPAGGTRFTMIDFAPGNAPFMHRTETVDYVIVLAGEVDMDVDRSSVRLKAGDVVIQRGTNHSWVNRGTQPARAAFVLIDAKPLGIGRPVTDRK